MTFWRCWAEWSDPIPAVLSCGELEKMAWAARTRDLETPGATWATVASQGRNTGRVCMDAGHHAPDAMGPW